MKNNAEWWEPDKIIKDILWEDIESASVYAKGKLLDIGCGRKPYKKLFTNVTEYVGIDSKGKFADIKKDFFKVVLKTKSFNTVLCTQVMEHVPDPMLLLTKIYAVLKTNGYLILTVPLVGSLHEEPTDFYRFTKYSLKYLLKNAGFSVVYIKEEGNWISSISNLICFYLEGTLNKHYLRYPKKIILTLVQLSFYFLSLLPNRFTKPEKCPMNYIIVARK